MASLAWCPTWKSSRWTTGSSERRGAGLPGCVRSAPGLAHLALLQHPGWRGLSPGRAALWTATEVLERLSYRPEPWDTGLSGSCAPSLGSAGDCPGGRGVHTAVQARGLTHAQEALTSACPCLLSWQPSSILLALRSRRWGGGVRWLAACPPPPEPLPEPRGGVSPAQGAPGAGWGTIGQLCGSFPPHQESVLTPAAGWPHPRLSSSCWVSFVRAN